MATIDDLNAAVATITTAVTDASNGIKDIASKLAAASSLNPADVETAANKLTSLAASLESAVQAAGEPVTAPAAPAETPPPAPAPASGETSSATTA